MMTAIPSSSAISFDSVICGRLMATIRRDLIAVALRKQALVGGLRHISIPKEFGLLRRIRLMGIIREQSAGGI
ncbi:hypothetical protein COCNU_10G004760 [Cocos nucifera]|uniref:Uncharacterized protein n=1 Tax=Cocos nucifera TaxID=13894 RepID=A0A8K0IME9_COCNU|nr:hypothetical protein COCNU_10G004760 [Cocos nucifera]